MKMTALGIVLSMLLLPLTVVSQATITSPAIPYTQDFVFLTTGTLTLVNNVTSPGWYSFRTNGDVPGGNIFGADDGSDFVGGFNNYGSTGSSDRALGSLATLPINTDTGTMYYGLRIFNGTGTTVQSVTVQYAGEQWRDSSLTGDTLAFSYQVGPTVTTLTGAFTPFPALNFVTPTNTGALAPVDGNAAANRTVVTSTIVVAIPAGQEIMLRWEDIPEGVIFNQGIGIDDVSVTFGILGPTAAGVSISGQAVTAGGVGIGNAVLILSGGSLERPLIARTNAFGYYQIDGVPAGATYLLEINSKRYIFGQPTQVINAQDNVTGVDFIADGK